MNDPDCLEGTRTREQLAAEFRELEAAAPTPADKFALMFGLATREKHEKVLDILAEVLDDWRAGLSPDETPSYQRAAALLQENPKP